MLNSSTAPRASALPATRRTTRRPRTPITRRSIYSGSHAGVWDTCATCHLEAREFGFVECLLCHEHHQRDTDAIHKVLESYRYKTKACLDCHRIFPG